MSTIVYTLVSHDFRMLPAQLEVIRKNVDDLSRIVVVQGPFGSDPNLSAGNRCILEDMAEELGVDILELDGTSGGLMGYRRLNVIVSQVRDDAITQPERFVFVLQSDVFPLLRANAVAILADHHVAGRGMLRRNNMHYWPTWVAFDTEAPETQNWAIRRGKMLGEAQSKPYHAYPAVESPEFIPGFGKIEEPSYCSFEWWEPVWLYLDQGIASTDEMIAKKLKGAGDLLDMQLPNYDPSVVLDGPLPIFMPQLIFPQTPKEFGRFGGTSPPPVWAPGEWQANQYRGAIRLWRNRGEAFRPDDAVAMIYDKLCTPCQYYEDGACQACGCGITGTEEELRLVVPDFDDNHPLRNKIKLATEHCPQWKW